MNKRKACRMVVPMLIVLALAVIPAVAAQEPAELTGRTTFAGVLTESGFEFLPADVNFCPATATIVQEAGGMLVLEVAECGDYRTCTWEFTLTEGGAASGGPTTCVPDYETGTLVGDVQLHTGCEVTNGTFPVYVGTWDGSTLSVAGNFLGPCEGGTMWGEASFFDPGEGFPGVDDPEGYLDDGLTADDGPAQVTFGLDLTVSAPAETLPETGGAFPVQLVLVGLGGLAAAGGLGAPRLRRRWR
jgi:LPXTG-motif cell wall-anchored protein